MTYCSNCGEQISNSAKFCSECGSRNSGASNHQNWQQEHAGKIYKCPSCYENLKSFMTACPSCGFELRGSKATEALKNFEYRYSQLRKPQEKIDYIKTFAIPNTKEDVLEFMILASANIDPDVFRIDKHNHIDARVSNAWIAKMEQAYQKAQLLFEDTSEFEKIQKLYLKQQNTIFDAKESGEKIRKTKNRNARFEKNMSWIGPTALFFIFLFLMIAIPKLMFLSEENEYKKLQNELNMLVLEVEENIAIKDFVTARIKANQVIDDSGWSSESEEKWDSIRISLIEEIEIAQDKAEGNIKVGYKPKELIGKNYEEVVSKLEAKGFTNIHTKRLDDLITGWIKKDGEVSEVSISSDTTFNENSKYVSNTEIIIFYHSFKE